LHRHSIMTKNPSDDLEMAHPLLRFVSIASLFLLTALAGYVTKEVVLEQEQAVKIKRYFTVARLSYVAGKYDDCIHSLVYLHSLTSAYENSRELESFCFQGKDLVKHQQEIESAEETVTVNSTDSEIIGSICRGPLQARLEKWLLRPPLPEVKIISGFTGINRGIASLSRQLRRLDAKDRSAVDRLAKDVGRFCKAANWNK
jgi:hypothetical protein